MENENIQTPVVSDQSLPQEIPLQENGPDHKKKFIIVGVVVLIAFFLIPLTIFAVQKLTYKPKIIQLTDKQQSATVHIKPNDTVVVGTKTLTDLDIKIQISDPSVVNNNKQQTYDNLSGAYTGKFTAIKPGESDVIVTGSPACKKGQVCLPLEVVIYKEHIVVDK